MGVRSLSEMIQSLFGIETTTHEDRVTLTVGAAAERITFYDPKRVGLVVVNLSANALYLAPGNNVLTTHGIYVAPNGGSMSLVWDRDFELCASEWFGIAGGAGSAIYTLETVISA